MEEFELEVTGNMVDMSNYISDNMFYGMEEFESELTTLINKHAIENIVDMPDYILASMICRMILAIGPSIKENNAWHGWIT